MRHPRDCADSLTCPGCLYLAAMPVKGSRKTKPQPKKKTKPASKDSRKRRRVESTTAAPEPSSASASKRRAPSSSSSSPPPPPSSSSSSSPSSSLSASSSASSSSSSVSSSLRFQVGTRVFVQKWGKGHQYFVEGVQNGAPDGWVMLKDCCGSLDAQALDSELHVVRQGERRSSRL
jgi:hypothetical protein